MTRRKRLFWGLLAGVLAAIAGVTVFFIFYHPPMRLMPAPLLFQDASRPLIDLDPALTDGNRIEVFYGASRLPVGPRDARIYTVMPDSSLHLGRTTMRIGDEGSTLDQIFEWSTGAERTDRPFIHLERMTEYATLADAWDVNQPPSPEAERWFAEIDAELAKSRHRDILIYVHGANTTVERAAGQASQLRHFTGRNAVVVLFVWPTAENFLRYTRDIDAAYGSAGNLAGLITQLATHTTARNINVFTYSAGATVGTAGLSLLAERTPEVADRLGEVYHAAPDADFRGFVDAMAHYGPHANRVTSAVNLGDSALRLAAAVNRASRAGRPDLSELDAESAEWLLEAGATPGIDILQIHPESMAGLPSTSHTFWYDDPWVSNDVIVLLLFNLPPAERALDKAVSPSGHSYWTFPPDYPDRMPVLRDSLLGRVGETTPR